MLDNVYTEKWWSDSDGSTAVAVVTGGNKGIGYEIAKNLAHLGLKTVLTARNEQLGMVAAASIQQATGKEVQFSQLDITDPNSVDRFALWAKSELPDGITALVNNAGMAFKGDRFDAEAADETILCNYRGTRRVCESLLPLMATKNARIVNVCSMAGSKRIIKSPELKKRFEEAAEKGPLAMDELHKEFIECIKAGDCEAKGWPRSMYGVSKLLEQTYTRWLCGELAPRGIPVHGCCPGYCATDMSSHKGPKSAEAGADTPVYQALLPPGTGDPMQFLQEREPYPAWS